MTPNAIAATITGPIARPSSPSVRFTAFDAPTTIRPANRMYQAPRSGIHSLTKGTESCVVTPSDGYR